MKNQARKIIDINKKNQTWFEEAWFKLINKMLKNLLLHDKTKTLKENIIILKKKLV